MSLNIKKFVVNPIEENTFIVSDLPTKEAVIIDPGCFTEEEWERLKHYIDAQGLHLTRMLCTHTHFDHVLGAGFVARDFGLKAECSLDDMQQLHTMGQQVAMFLGEFAAKHLEGLRHPVTTVALKEGDCIELGNSRLHVIATPGHTPGGLCFYCPEDSVLFSGDSLFHGSIGRTDLPGGNYKTLIESLLGKLLTLPAETHVYCGHGDETTIEYEQNYNPYL